MLTYGWNRIRLKSGKSEARAAAVRRLANGRGRRGAGALLAFLREASERENSSEVLRLAVDAVADRDDPAHLAPLRDLLAHRSREVLPGGRVTFHHRSTQIPVLVLDALARKGHANAVAFLGDAMAHPEADVAGWTVEAIARSGNPAYVPVLRAALNDSRDAVRFEAAAALASVFHWAPSTDEERVAFAFAGRRFDELGRLGPDGRELLVKALDGHEGLEAARGAAAALGEIGDASAREALYRTLSSSHLVGQTESLVAALARLEDPRLFEWAAGHIWSSTGLVPIAIQAFGSFRHPSAFDQLAPMLGDFDARPWDAAASAAAEAGDPRAIPILIEAFDHFARKPRWDESLLKKITAASALDGMGDGCAELGLPLCARAPSLHAKLEEIRKALAESPGTIPAEPLRKLAALERVWSIRRDDDFTDDPDRTYEIVGIGPEDCADIASAARAELERRDAGLSSPGASGSTESTR